LLGDGVTSLSIKGVGVVKCKVGSHVLTIPNVRYIPDLSESVYSLFQHIQTKDHRLESSYDEGLFIIFRTKAIIGTDDIYLNFLPLAHSDLETISTDTSIDSPSLEKCNHLTEFHKHLGQEISSIDRLLNSLREVYGIVKTKRQLGLEVPAGFVKIQTIVKITDMPLLLGSLNLFHQYLLNLFNLY